MRSDCDFKSVIDKILISRFRNKFVICCLPFFVCTDTEKIDLYPEAFKLVVYVKTITQQGQIYLLPFTAANKISAKIISF